MKKTILLFTLLSLFLFTGCTKQEKEITLEPYTMTVRDETIQLVQKDTGIDNFYTLIPESLEKMSEEMAKVKYPLETRPDMIYTNESGSINFAFSDTGYELQEKDIEEYLSTLIDTFKEISPTSQILNHHVDLHAGNKIGILEMITQAVDTNIYNYMWYQVIDQRLVISTFNCKEEDMDAWRDVAMYVQQHQKITSKN